MSRRRTPATASCFTSVSPTLSGCQNFLKVILMPVALFFFCFRTTQRLTPPSCEARRTRRVWRASGRVPSMWCRCELGPWLVLANTAARCASKLSQMVRIPEPERSGRPVSLHPPLSHFVSLAHTHVMKKIKRKNSLHTLVALCICLLPHY